MSTPPQTPDGHPAQHRGDLLAPLDKLNVLVGITGGIACYKAADLVSGLAQEKANVRVVMTRAARRFVGPLTYESLSGGPVITSVWGGNTGSTAGHIEAAAWCDLMIIAPATADAIARLASGLADNPVTLIAGALPRTTPVLIAPAMNANMWANPITQRNAATLRDVLGYHLAGPETGWQACRTVGTGRMSEPDDLIKQAAALLTPA